MADFLQKYTLAAGTPVSIQADDTIIGFDFTNDSPFDIDIQWKSGQAIALTVPPTTIWSGVKPDSILLISGYKRSGIPIATPSYPGGGTPPAGAPAMQLTVHGYVKGNVPPESKTPLNRLQNVGNTVPVSNPQPPIAYQVNTTGQDQTIFDFQDTKVGSKEFLFKKAALGLEYLDANSLYFMLVLSSAGGNTMDNGQFATDGTGVVSASSYKTRTGVQETGVAGGSLIVTGAQQVGLMTNFKTVLTNVPSSVTFTTLQSANGSSPTFDNMSVYGFRFLWTAGGAGGTTFLVRYVTAGN